MSVNQWPNEQASQKTGMEAEQGSEEDKQLTQAERSGHQQERGGGVIKALEDVSSSEGGER